MIVTSRNKPEMWGVVSAPKIIGEVMVNQQDEDLGKIHELVIDAKEGRLAYMQLSSSHHVDFLIPLLIATFHMKIIGFKLALWHGIKGIPYHISGNYFIHIQGRSSYTPSVKGKALSIQGSRRGLRINFNFGCNGSSTNVE